MAYTTKYRIEFSTVYGNEVRIDLQENGTHTIQQLDGQTYSLSYLNFDREKPLGISASQLDFTILVDGDFDASVFLTQTSTQTKVLLYVNNVLNWCGWLDTEDLQQPLRDTVSPITLVAKDGLHLLSTAEFRTFGGLFPVGSFKLSDIIAFCLSKTELGLNFLTWIDIYPVGLSTRSSGNPERDPFYQTNIYTWIFQTSSADFDSPFQVLQKILLSFKCALFQARGKWHIVYLEDRMRTVGLNATEWDSTGNAVGIFENQYFRLTAGLDQDIEFINNDALITWQPAFKQARHNLNFRPPIGMIFNGDFDIAETLISTSGTTETRSADYWVSLNGIAPGKIVWEYLDGEVISKRLLLDTLAVMSPPPFPVNIGDYFTITANGGGDCSIMVRVTTSLNMYYLQQNGKWSSHPNPHPIQSFVFGIATDWQSTAANIDPIPADGIMEIGLARSPGGTSTASINNISISYDDRIDVNKKADGYYYLSQQDGTFKNEFVDDLYLFDSNSSVTAGTLGNPLWKHRLITESLRLGRLITRAMWKFVYRNFYRLEGRMAKIIHSNYILSPLNTLLPDAFPDREFTVGTLTMDLRNEQAEFTIVEINNTTDTADYTETGQEKAGFYGVFRPEEQKRGLEDLDAPPAEFGLLGELYFFLFKRKRRRR